MSIHSIFKKPLPSSRLTEIRQNRMVYANYISKKQVFDQGCDRIGTGLENGLVAPSSELLKIYDGALNTTIDERDAILVKNACPIQAIEEVYTVVQNGLVLYYDVGNSASYPGSGTTIFDLSPSGFHGTLVNGPTYSATNGGSLVFNGINSYIDTNQALSSEEYTLIAWFKASDVTLFRMLFSKETPAGLPWNYRLWLFQTTGYPVGDIAKTGASSQVTYSQNLADGNWHMLAFSRNITTDKLNLYLDGNLINSQTDAMPAGTIINSQEVWIGFSAFSGGSYPFLGNIGSALIYNRPLTDAEILNNFRATKTRFGL